MKGTIKTQNVINLAKDLFDDCGYGRIQILYLLRGLVANGIWDATEDTILGVFDLIVG